MYIYGQKISSINNRFFFVFAFRKCMGTNKKLARKSTKHYIKTPRIQSVIMLKNKRRFILACLIPFISIFSKTLIETNAVFALDGMVNHTAVDRPDPQFRPHMHSIDHADVCVKVNILIIKNK